MVDGTGLNLTDELEHQNYRLDCYFKEHMPQCYQLMKDSICSVPSLNHFPRSCAVKIYGPMKLVETIDDTSIIDFMFPIHDTNCTETMSFRNETGWQFAEAVNWLSPSMAIYTPNYMYPVHWLSRVSLYNALHEQDYLLTVILKY